MRENFRFGFGFRTREENGTLIFQSSKLAVFQRKQREADTTGKGYLAFYLFRGYLVLHFGKDASSRKEVITIRSSQMYNDGQLHSVFMSRKGKNVRLRVDDRVVGEVQTLNDESAIGTASSQMFIGGFAERFTPPNNEIPTTVPLIGCISDMYHNYKKIPVIPLEHNAQLGTCAIESPNFAVPIDEPLDMDSIGGHRKDSRLNHQLDRNYYGILYTFQLWRMIYRCYVMKIGPSQEIFMTYLDAEKLVASVDTKPANEELSSCDTADAIHCGLFCRLAMPNRKMQCNATEMVTLKELGNVSSTNAGMDSNLLFVTLQMGTTYRNQAMLCGMESRKVPTVA
ncbi:laminin G domain protein [Oesophagostomum dentatum]|uniref:Laminin G domain protein n=1 Tax=Oesophagostomum dentatum TaxID=61180 RepID=A0A0B1TPY2_OESDE|nr:laminin G domain protein [Oesophagostomum dentatum]